MKKHRVYLMMFIIGSLAVILALTLAACSGAAFIQANSASGQAQLPDEVSQEMDLGLLSTPTQVQKASGEAQNTPTESQIASDAVQSTPTQVGAVQTVSQDAPQDENIDEEVARPGGWQEETHSDSVDPNYDVVFPQDQVNRIDISISPQDWQAMMDDMTALYGEQGAGGQGGIHPGGDPPVGQPPPRGGPQAPGDPAPPGDAPPGPGGQPPPANPGGMMMGDSENPIWVPAQVEFDGDVWTHVGVRFKGNSSLMASWRSGNMKLPFKLDFDEFEDDYPEIDDQRFYGFKQLTLSSSFKDDSLLREKVAADIFREAGVAAPNTAFYALYVNYGDGPIYFGLYTMVEVVDDTFIETQFEEDSGNIYKPEGAGATFAEGTFSEDSFDKETNQDEGDYSDILALYEALHSDLRTSDLETWRANLETMFDVETFIRWLAVNTVIQNWDTYGLMNHNYYLYNDPTSGQLTWIPWDNNGAMQKKEQRGILSLGLKEVDDEWPLIRYLMDDPVYYDRYLAAVEETINGAFEPAKMAQTFQQYHDLIQPYVTGENGEQVGYSHLSSADAFESSVGTLIDHVNSRYQQANDFIHSQR